MNVTINTVAKALPAYSRETKDILPLVKQWLSGQEERYQRKVLKIFEGAGVSRRYAIMEPEDVFTKTSFQDKNDHYAKAAIHLGNKALSKALEKSNWLSTDIDYLITVSCTGIMIPSLDAYLINDLKLRQDVMRLPVTEMGCAAGVSGIIYAYQFLKANPGKRAAVVAVEAPTATFQLDDFSMTNMVSAAIFGDGAACVLLSSNKADSGPKILGEGMYHFYNATHLMGFSLKNSGLQMILDKSVPQMIASNFPKIVNPFLNEYDLDIKDIEHLIFHPGGKKIVQTTEQLFGEFGKNINQTKAVLDAYGNMSSVTVLYVLEEFLNQKIKLGTHGLMLSFGPGFSAQRVLLSW